MSVVSITQKTPKLDYFSVFPAGFYVLLLVAILISNDGPNKTLWEELRTLSVTIYENPMDLIIVLFASYLFGSIFRALPVEWADTLSRPFNNEKFPYSKDLLNSIKLLKDNRESAGISIDNLPNTEIDISSNIYNYWKNSICLNAPEAFEHYLTYEARVRFFASMFFSGLFGIIVGYILLAQVSILEYSAAWQIIAFSSFILLVFGLELRRVRRQESKLLLMLFISYLQRNNDIS